MLKHLLYTLLLCFNHLTLKRVTINVLVLNNQTLVLERVC